MMKQKVALKLAYFGLHFHGYARQPTVDTIENRIISKLFEKQIISDLKEAKIRCASRTDKHVSAVANVMTFYTLKAPRTVLSLLADEFESIFPYGITTVPDDFNPRYALKRTYHYLLPSEQFPIKQLRTALSLFPGNHDFSNFARIEPHRNPIRTIDSIHINQHEGFLIVEVSAQTFLWNQIRRIMEASIKYCKEKISLDQIKQALDEPETPVDLNIAPASPLILTRIDYPEITFFEDERLKKKKDVVTSMVKQHITHLDF